MNKLKSVLKNKNILQQRQTSKFSSKVYTCAKEATKDITDGSKILVGGFGLCGVPNTLIQALQSHRTKNLTIVSNNPGLKDYGVGLLLNNNQVKRLVSSYVGENEVLQKKYLNGEIELELTPAGTLAEKCRAAGHGIPAFYTPAGAHTYVAAGSFTIKYKPNQAHEPEIVSSPKERRNFKGKEYILEETITGDYAFVKAKKADKYGNLVFNRTGRNFNQDMATASKCVIAEVEEIVENGEIDPDLVHVPGVFVHRIYKQSPNQDNKPIQKLTLQNSTPQKSEVDNSISPQIKDKILKRAAQEITDGMYINLSNGFPSLLPQYLPKNISVEIHSENGFIGVPSYPNSGQQDPDIINAANETVLLGGGSSIFSSSQSYGIIRGGHLDIAFVSGQQVSQEGDIGDWSSTLQQGCGIKGMGGSMDIAYTGSKLVCLMQHSNSTNQTHTSNSHKLLANCSLPLIAKGVVHKVITEKAVFEKIDGQLVLTEIAHESSLEDIQAHTGFTFKTISNVGRF